MCAGVGYVHGRDAPSQQLRELNPISLVSDSWAARPVGQSAIQRHHL